MNHLNQVIRLILAVVAGVTAFSALAEVTAEEAKQLGGPVLTLFGAEKAGNQEGTIPDTPVSASSRRQTGIRRIPASGPIRMEKSRCFRSQRRTHPNMPTSSTA